MASAKVDTSKPEVPINAQPGEGKGPTAETLNMWTPGISKEVLGLKIVAQPPELDEIEIDVVAVHGIGVNPKSTWVHSKTKVNWLSDTTMLPEALPKARIMTYNYESYWFGDNAVKQTVSKVANKMLLALRDKREECRDRPIIFLGHCFGGLVIQELYNLARLHSIDHPTVAKSLAGMVFLGTPHRGVKNNSGLTTQGQIYQAIVKSQVPILDNALHSMAQQNDMLIDIVAKFNRSINNQGANAPKLFCFSESKATPIGGIVGMKNVPLEFVVDESSAELTGHEHESLELNHFDINKFESPDDDHYASVRRQIVAISKASLSKVSSQRNERPSLNSPPFSPKHHIPSLAAPIAREAHFAERNNILQLLEEKFHASMNVVLQGDSGNGKTHVAVEYAHKFHREHPDSHVHWVNAGSASEFELSYKRIAENLHLSRKSYEDGNVVDTVYNVMRQDVGGQWLMVLDGLNDKALLKINRGTSGDRSLLDLVPKSARARILTTTRSRTIALESAKKRTEYVIDVPTLLDTDASFLLYETHTKDEAKIKRAATVSKSLGASAGTLVLARVYHRVTQMRWKEYLDKVREGEKLKDSDGPACRAWQLVYEVIKGKDSNAAQLLLRIGCLNVQSISTVLFDRQDLKYIEQLVDHGMVEPSTDRRFYTVTPLIRRCVQSWLEKTKEKEFVEGHVLSNMCDRFSADDHHTADALLPCALAMLEFQPTSVDAKRDLATILFRVAHQFNRFKRDDTALEYFNRCLSLQKEDPDAKADVIQQTQDAIKKTMSERDKSKAAAKPPSNEGNEDIQYQKAKKELRDVEKQVGEDSYETIGKATNLASLQVMRGTNEGQEEAVKHYERSLQRYKKKNTHDTIETARLQNNLALAQENCGNLKQAMSLYQSASETMERHLGPNHPELLKVHGNIASMYGKQGQMEAAKKLFGVILPNQQKLLGKDHPDTLEARRNFAIMLGEMGQLKAAEAELERILGAQERLQDDRGILRTSCSLADNYRSQGRLADARDWYEYTLKSQESLLGKDHRETVMTRVMLAELPKEEDTKVKAIKA